MIYIATDTDLQSVFNEIKNKFVSGENKPAFDQFIKNFALQNGNSSKRKKMSMREEEEAFNEGQREGEEERESTSVEIFGDNIQFIAEKLRSSLTHPASVEVFLPYQPTDNHIENIHTLIKLEQGFCNNLIRIKYNIGLNLKLIKGNRNVFLLHQDLAHRNMHLSKSEIYFALRFYEFICIYPRILHSSLSVSFFKEHFKYLHSICSKDVQFYSSVN